MVTCPRPPVFARPNILVASFATQARACILSDHNISYTPRGGGNGGVMPLGLFLFLCKYSPGNSNTEGKGRTVRVSGGSSYRGGLNIQCAMLIIDS